VLQCSIQKYLVRSLALYTLCIACEHTRGEQMPIRPIRTCTPVLYMLHAYAVQTGGCVMRECMASLPAC
jgi:hypothetical protein